MQNTRTSAEQPVSRPAGVVRVSADPTGLQPLRSPHALGVGDAVLSLAVLLVVSGATGRHGRRTAAGSPDRVAARLLAWWLLLAPSRRLGIVASPAASFRWIRLGGRGLRRHPRSDPLPRAGANGAVPGLSFVVVTSGATFAWRLAYGVLLFRDRFRRRAAILGTDDDGRSAFAAIRERRPTRASSLSWTSRYRAATRRARAARLLGQAA